MRLRVASFACWLFALCLLGACARAGEEPELVWVALAGQTFRLELALAPQARYRGLSGRTEIPPRGGMLFVLPRPERFAMVMRDCPVPIDVAFLDARGTVLGVHEMAPEEPRRPGETAGAYERRLRAYPSGGAAQFAIEVAGGSLRRIGLAPGDRVPLDVEDLAHRAR